MTNQKVKTEVPTSSVNLKTVFIQSSNFKRGLSDEPPELKMEMKISIKNANEDPKFWVTQFIKLVSDSTEDFLFEVEMTAEFEKGIEFNSSIEEFGNINAAAIIYAYTRQHITSMTLNAGMTPIILPIINFVEHYRKRTQKEKKQ